MAERVDYNQIAGTYGDRYTHNDYSDVERVLASFVGGARERRDVVEVGCGTGHWIHRLREWGKRGVGVDLSRAMLRVARQQVEGARLVCAAAESLPLRTDSFDRVVCINALHHFSEAARFFHEAGRVLRGGGEVFTVGLDPHAGQDTWWIYDYFPEALAADRTRYLPAATIRELMQEAGLDRCTTWEVQHLPRLITVREADTRGFFNGSHTSQLMVISVAAYDAGLRRIRAESGDRVLRADLRLYGTSGRAV